MIYHVFLVQQACVEARTDSFKRSSFWWNFKKTKHV